MRETIFKGATRPPMVFSIPLTAFIGIGGGGVLFAMWGGLLISKWLGVAVVAAAIPTMVWIRVISKRDDQRLRQIWLSVLLRRNHPNARFWNGRSYSPVNLRGTRDEFAR